MLICLSSIRGGVGVSSWSLLLGGAWPGDADRIVVEADVAGGTASVRYGLNPDPGVASLLFDCRLRPETGIDPARHGRRLADGLWCIPGPESTEQSWPVWQAGSEAFARLLVGDDRIWLLDCGRLLPSGPIEPLIRAADAHVVFADRTDETMVALPDRIGTLAGAGRVVIGLVGRIGRSAREVGTFTGCESVRELPSVRRLSETAADGLRPGARRRWRGWRAASELAAELAGGAPAGGCPTADRPPIDRLALRPPDPPDWAYWDRSAPVGWTPQTPIGFELGDRTVSQAGFGPGADGV